MTNIILTTPEELKSIVSEAIAGILPHKAEQKSQIDTITLTDALKLLKENGYPTSKGKIYKLTSTGEIPCSHYGNKLVFSRKELLDWAANQTKRRHDFSEESLVLARSARRKR